MTAWRSSGCVWQRAWWIALAIVAAHAGFARAQGLTNYASHQQVGRSVVVTTDSGQRVRITPYGDAIVRVQAIPSGTAFIPDDRYAMVASHDSNVAFTVADGSGALDLITPAARVHVTKQPVRLALFRTGAATAVLSDGAGVVFGAGSVAQRFAPDGGERFAGLGHSFYGRVGKLDLTGSEQTRNYGATQNDQAPLIVPFYLSSRGYGVFVNSPFANRFRFNVAGSYETSLAGTEMDYFVFLGPDLPGVLGQYVALTGKPRLPPLAMFGLALSDKAHAGLSAADWWQQTVHDHRAAGYPIDHMVNDNRWRAGGGERCMSRFEWDAGRYPDPAAFHRWMAEQGLVATLDFNRCIANQSQGWQQSYNLPNPGVVEFGASVPDLSRGDVRAWWWNLIFGKTLDPALDYPGDALWIDEFDEMGSAPADQVLGNGRTWGEMRNLWFLQIALALGEDGWDKAMQKRPFTWVRGGTAGGQRYVTLWSGDIDPSFGEMKQQIRGMLAAGLGGFPFWGHDAGGFKGDLIGATAFEEIYQQWSMAFGAFTPYWKPHGTVHSRWPSDRSADSQHVAQVYGDLRYRLLPYTYSFAREASSTGMPLARALLLAYPDRAEAWANDLEYLWGSELLVAPNAAAGYTNVNLWLPPGDWYDFWSDDRVAGDRTIQAWAPPGRVVLYAKAGAIIPMAPPASSTAFMPRDVLDIHVYDGADGTFTLREDDGVSEDYRTSGHRETTLSYSAASRTLAIRGAQGGFAAAPDTRRYRVYVHGLTTAACATVDGVEVAQLRTEHDARVLGSGAAWSQHANSGVLAVVTPAKPIASDVAIAVRACAADVPTRFEAEAGTTNATVSTKPTASGGGYVGALNVPGSYVEITVTAASAGDHDVVIGYANGRAARAVRGLYVGGTRVRDVVFATTPDWDAFSVSDRIRVPLAAGANTLRLQTDADDAETVDLDFIDVYPTAAEPLAPFYEDDGLTVVEAEHDLRRLDAGGHAWRDVTFSQGYAGDGAVAAQPDLGIARAAGEPTPTLDYDIVVADAGAHTLWVRGNAYGRASADSVTVALDDGAPVSVDLAAADGFQWAKGSTTLEIAEGTHTLHVAMAEDGAIIDRVLLTTDPAFTPEGTGPDESGHTPPGDDDDPGGCGCRAPATGCLPLALVTLAVVLRRRRR
jgi:alpha-glucosidase (family GH31 glycosyl hydrolase)